MSKSVLSNHPVGPVVLCILDGFGDRPERENNAVALASTPNYDRYIATGPHARIQTSGLSVGLPEGQMGNSEVGHMNLGAGRVVTQDLPRIDDAITNGDLAKNQTLLKSIADIKAAGGTCHLFGLLSPGGVHSHQDHIVALARILHSADVEVWIHAFLDGRDTPPKSAAGFVANFEKDLGRSARIATVTGRYFAMDRDKNWDRVEQAWAAMVVGKGEPAASAAEAIETSYANDKSDEFMTAHVIEPYTGMDNGDGLLCANFRADRAREILTTLVDPTFDGFERSRQPDFSTRLGMVSYSDALSPFMTTLFPAADIQNTIGEWVAEKGKSQLRIAETEKYAHVTFFLNGGRETPFDLEERILVPSPKVATYDLQPEMSAPEVTDKLVGAITSKKFDLIVVNYANPDMVGHTGILGAAKIAIETIDLCLGRLEDALVASDGVMLVTADHGNVELMVDISTGAPHTAHTSLEVPMFMVNPQALGQPIDLEKGRLADIAPTILDIMGVEPPSEMTGTSLLSAPSAKQSEDRATA